MTRITDLEAIEAGGTPTPPDAVGMIYKVLHALESKREQEKVMIAVAVLLGLEVRVSMRNGE